MQIMIRNEIYKRLLEELKGHGEFDSVIKQIESKDINSYFEARKMFRTEKQKYYRRQQWKWIALGAGILIGFLISYYVPIAIHAGFVSSKFGRESLDDLMLDTYGDVMIKDAMKELCIISYEYKSQTPRLYSRHFANDSTLKDMYDVSLFDAAGATSAAPIYFDPKIRVTPSGVEEYLIDGGIIENNPSIYAITLAHDIIGIEKPIRLVSLGTGNYESKPIDPNDFSVIDWWQKTGFLMTNLSQRNSAFDSAHRSANYIRLQGVSKVKLDGHGEVDLLVKQGKEIIEGQKDEIDELVRILVEENKNKLYA